MVHHGSTGKRIEVENLLEAIMETNLLFFGGVSWAARRQEANSPLDALGSDFRTDALLNEFDVAITTLRPAVVRRYLGFNKRVRSYLCPYCTHSAEATFVNLAQLKPNTPTSTRLHCFLCEADIPVRRRRCLEPGCKSNVICADPDFKGTCMLCWCG